MEARFGGRCVPMGPGGLGWLKESNDALGDVDTLRTLLDDQGYLLIRGLQPRERVEEARRLILDSLAANGQIDCSFPLSEGRAAPGCSGAFLGGSKKITRTQAFLGLVESPEIMGFFRDLLAGEVLTFDYKWLRAVAPGESTGAHYDIVYMGRGTDRLYTCWTPITEVTLDRGPLAILSGSHRLERLKETYGRLDVDRDMADGAFTRDPFEVSERYGGEWLTSEFNPGDVMIFGMYLMHASCENTSGHFRISSDTRYQLANQSVDERWVGKDPLSHYGWEKARKEAIPLTQVEDLRKQWGV